MIGVDALTGGQLSGDAHLAQSIGDILATPIGSRVERRDYGSALFELVDAPLNPLTRIRAFAATALALARWEPRVTLTGVSLDASDPAQPRLELRGTRTEGARNPLTSLVFPLRPASRPATA